MSCLTYVTIPAGVVSGQELVVTAKDGSGRKSSLIVTSEMKPGSKIAVRFPAVQSVKKTLKVQVPVGVLPGTTLSIPVPGERGRVLKAIVPPNATEFHLSYYSDHVTSNPESHRSSVADSTPKDEIVGEYQKQQEILCPNQHPTTRCITEHFRYHCDVCSKQIGLGCTVFGCRRCDWDACERCAFQQNALTRDQSHPEASAPVEPSPMCASDMYSHAPCNFPYPSAPIISEEPLWSCPQSSSYTQCSGQTMWNDRGVEIPVAAEQSPHAPYYMPSPSAPVISEEPQKSSPSEKSYAQPPPTPPNLNSYGTAPSNYFQGDGNIEIPVATEVLSPPSRIHPPPHQQTPVAPPGHEILLVKVPPGTPAGTMLEVGIPNAPGSFLNVVVPSNASQFHVFYKRNQVETGQGRAQQQVNTRTNQVQQQQQVLATQAVQDQLASLQQQLIDMQVKEVERKKKKEKEDKNMEYVKMGLKVAGVVARVGFGI